VRVDSSIQCAELFVVSSLWPGPLPFHLSQRSWMVECSTYGDLPSAIVSAHRIRPLELAQFVSVRPLSLTYPIADEHIFNLSARRPLGGHGSRRKAAPKQGHCRGDHPGRERCGLDQGQQRHRARGGGESQSKTTTKKIFHSLTHSSTHRPRCILTQPS
jgi:hypothetical protein